jgi:xanthine dehydrogenase YagS FAD-binding subunit
MNAFEYINAESLIQASTLLTGNQGRFRIIAGGTDIMGEVKEGTVKPSALVGLGKELNLGDISVSSDGVRIGALVTVAELASNADIGQMYSSLSQAALSVATPQIRNVGTIGGNLCQRPRCWFYRSPLYNCAKKGGSECFAISDNNKYHAIFGGSACHIVHPSDLAVALISLQAEISIQGSGDSKTIPLEDFFAMPDRDITVENILKPGEIVTQVVLPAASSGCRSVYLKAKERSAMDFALASVALAMDVSDGVIRNARVTLGGVAPIPWRVGHVEDALNGRAVNEIDANKIGMLAVRDARPLKNNGYKVRLAQGIVGKAVRTLLLNG